MGGGALVCIVLSILVTVVLVPTRSPLWTTVAVDVVFGGTGLIMVWSFFKHMTEERRIRRRLQAEIPSKPLPEPLIQGADARRKLEAVGAGVTIQ